MLRKTIPPLDQQSTGNRLYVERWLVLLLTALALAGCTRQEGPEKDPVTEVNTPRPTNNIPEHIPPERR